MRVADLERAQELLEWADVRGLLESVTTPESIRKVLKPLADELGFNARDIEDTVTIITRPMVGW